VRIAFLDRERAIAELRESARRIIVRDQRVLAVGLFGSLARREALPSSDADVLIVLKEHLLSRWFDRITEYADDFAGTSLPVEPFPYTQDEVTRMWSRGSGFLRSALRELIHLGGDQRVWEALRDGEYRASDCRQANSRWHGRSPEGIGAIQETKDAK
jgi:predicted nucleotidyltransferase